MVTIAGNRAMRAALIGSLMLSGIGAAQTQDLLPVVPPAPIEGVWLTTERTESLLNEAIRNGAMFILHKPFDDAELVSVVTSAINDLVSELAPKPAPGAAARRGRGRAAAASPGQRERRAAAAEFESERAARGQRRGPAGGLGAGNRAPVERDA